MTLPVNISICYAFQRRQDILQGYKVMRITHQ